MNSPVTSKVPTRLAKNLATQKPHRITRTEAQEVAEKAEIYANAKAIVQAAIARGVRITFPVKRGDL